MNLNYLNDDTLVTETKRLVKEETRILTSILYHLKEIARRRLFSNYKCGSLFEYAVKELGYSEDQAWRRIEAMKLLRELPQIEEKLNNGSLNLTHIGMASSLFKREEKSGNIFF